MAAGCAFLEAYCDTTTQQRLEDGSNGPPP